MEIQKFNPEYMLDYDDRLQLANMCSMPGFQIFQRICSSEVDKFFVRLVNADSADVNAVVAAHSLAKAAAQFYRGLEKRINEELTQFTGTFMKTDKPEADVTEGTLDLGEFADQIDELPNFLTSEEEPF